MNTNSFVNDGIRYTGHYFTLPLDYQAPTGEHLQVFARSVEIANETDSNKPWLVFFQGGPGFPSPRMDANHGWMKRALQQFRVLLLDQRGTGLSSPVTHETLASLTSEQQVTYLSHFRADNIVRDAESIREQWGIQQWAILGQSFGGFCSLTYLSLFPNSLLRSYITGGVPSIVRHADDVYRATYQHTQRKNQRFFQQFPQAQTWCRDIADYLLSHEVYLPNGQRFTVEQFQQIGIRFGVSDSFLPTYYALESAFVSVNGESVLNYAFLNDMLMAQAYQTNPIYAILHESIYCQSSASRWSAHRIRDEYPQFHYQSGQPFLFTGEMVYPWMFEQYQCLQPLKTAAMQLAEKSDWSMLYSPDTLSHNAVPISCAVYADDMFVDMELTKETLDAIPYARAWITNEYEHNGLRADGERVLDQLIQMGEQTASELGLTLLS
ncbi:alpha/beta fold hydrolase [Vibrio zhugei]|uniref:Alpha/beta fold hydrolase n=1 Tax=Vibrio zhugei TaxID=2479546 RepID=A0ABV7C9T7_9VIBR|nr:alpha/beta fold hydrolase [Vibrio zhugei]